MAASGTSRHFAAPHQIGRKRIKANIDYATAQSQHIDGSKPPRLTIPPRILNNKHWFINIACSRQVPPRRLNQAPAIVSAFSETLSPLLYV